MNSELHPDFPVVEGQYQMSSDWWIDLALPMNRRFEDDSLVLWRPGLTAWIIIWGNDHKESQEDRLAGIRKDISPDAFALAQEERGNLTYFGYRLDEQRPEGTLSAWYGFAIGDSGHVKMAIYCDRQSDIDSARGLWRSLRQQSQP